MRDVFTLQCEPFGSTTVASVVAREALSEPYRFDLGVLSERELDVDALSGERAKLSVASDESSVYGNPYHWHGVLRRVALVHAWDGHWLYRCVLAPAFWSLRLSHHSRVFTKTDTPTIVRWILEANGLSDADFEFRLTESYDAHDFVCQYKESDFDFVSRWLEREGLYYFFEHGDDREKIVFTDSASFHRGLRTAAVRYDPRPSEDVSAGESLRAFSVVRGLAPEGVELTDYDHLNPALNVFGQADVKKGIRRQVRLHGERFVTPAEGRRLAAVRAQEIGCRRIANAGVGHVTHLRPGYTWMLEGHPSENCNREFLTTSLEHLAAPAAADPWIRELLGVTHAGNYEVKVEAISSDVQYRSSRRTSKPRVAGLERARIDGPADTHFSQVDDHGRYKVKVEFDESPLNGGEASAWVRMLQPHGGSTEGFHFPLRKGTEVMLAFQGGDPDQPVIVGVAPNAHLASPVTKANFTRNLLQTGGDSRIEIEDKDDLKFLHLSTPTEDSFLHLGAPIPVSAPMAPGGGTFDNVLGLETIDDATMVMHTGGSSSQHVGGNVAKKVGGGGVTKFGKANRQFASDHYFEATNEFAVKAKQITLGATERLDKTSGSHKITANALYINTASVVQINTSYFDVFASDRIHLQVGGSSITIKPGDIEAIAALIKLNP